MTAAALAMASPTLAQGESLPRTQPLSATAQETVRPSLRPVDGPSVATQALVRQRVRTTLASVLDSGLPPLAFDDWLFTTLAPLMDLPWQPRADWRVRFCDDPRFPIPEGDSVLCVDASVRVTADKIVHIIVAASEPVVGSDGGIRWRSIPLNVRDVYVERNDGRSGIDSLDVPSLRELATMLRVPVEQWPVADLEATVSARDAAATPSRGVHFTIEVNNSGTRSTRASVRMQLQGEGGTDVLRDWFPEVRAGQSIRLEFDVPLPAGRATAVVIVEPARSTKVVREPHPRRDPAFTIVSVPTGRRQ